MDRHIYLLLLASAVSPMLGEELASPPRPEFSFETSAVSSFLWRGFVANDSPSLQPSATVAYGGLSINVWSNMSSSAPHNQAWTETDLTVEYSRRLGKWSVGAGFVDYEFPDTSAAGQARSAEVYLTCTYGGPWNVTAQAYRDFQLGDGYYYTVGSTKGFRLPASSLRGATLFRVGVNQHQFQRQTTISNVESTTSVDAFTTERMVFSPFVTVMVGHRTLFGTHAAFGLKAVLRR